MNNNPNNKNNKKTKTIFQQVQAINTSKTYPATYRTQFQIFYYAAEYFPLVNDIDYNTEEDKMEKCIISKQVSHNLWILITDHFFPISISQTQFELIQDIPAILSNYIPQYLSNLSNT